jgi:hypothetical protein|eukprot:COSAG06_NODE_8583_length_2124_cov_2647.899704_2_plen_173_part_00
MRRSCLLFALSLSLMFVYHVCACFHPSIRAGECRQLTQEKQKAEQATRAATLAERERGTAALRMAKVCGTRPIRIMTTHIDIDIDLLFVRLVVSLVCLLTRLLYANTLRVCLLACLLRWCAFFFLSFPFLSFIWVQESHQVEIASFNARLTEQQVITLQYSASAAQRSRTYS